MNTRAIVGLVMLVAFTVVLLTTFASQVGEYQNFDDAASTGKRVHVVGEWAAEHPIAYDAGSNVFSFHMRDEAGSLREVHYTNPKPANFEDAERLVIEGRAEGEIFVADNILVKCPSKYNETEAPQVDVGT